MWCGGEERALGGMPPPPPLVIRSTLNVVCHLVSFPELQLFIVLFPCPPSIHPVSCCSQCFNFLTTYVSRTAMLFLFKLGIFFVKTVISSESFLSHFFILLDVKDNPPPSFPITVGICLRNGMSASSKLRRTFDSNFLADPDIIVFQPECSDV